VQKLLTQLTDRHAMKLVTIFKVKPLPPNLFNLITKAANVVDMQNSSVGLTSALSQRSDQKQQPKTSSKNSTSSQHTVTSDNRTTFQQQEIKKKMAS
jgi:hypothetical protein